MEINRAEETCQGFLRERWWTCRPSRGMAVEVCPGQLQEGEEKDRGAEVRGLFRRWRRKRKRQVALGELLRASTRPDIAFAVGQASREAQRRASQAARHFFGEGRRTGGSRHKGPRKDGTWTNQDAPSCLGRQEQGKVPALPRGGLGHSVVGRMEVLCRDGEMLGSAVEFLFGVRGEIVESETS